MEIIATSHWQICSSVRRTSLTSSTPIAGFLLFTIIKMLSWCMTSRILARLMFMILITAFVFISLTTLYITSTHYSYSASALLTSFSRWRSQTLFNINFPLELLFALIRFFGICLNIRVIIITSLWTNTARAARCATISQLSRCSLFGFSILFFFGLSILFRF